MILLVHKSDVNLLKYKHRLFYINVQDDGMESQENKNNDETEELNVHESDCKTKSDATEDLLTESEPNDTTSESDSSDSENGANAENVNKIEWSQIDQGKRLIQELREEQSCDAQWGGFNVPSITSDRYLSMILRIRQIIR